MTSRRSVVVSLVLVALVALAGCASGPLNDASDATGTDASTATTAATTASLEDISFPDGASEDAVENGTALAAAHTDVVTDGGYALELTAARSGPETSVNSTYVVRRGGDTGDLYQRTVRNSGGGTQQAVVFANESAIYEKRGTDSPSYEVDTSRSSDDHYANNIVEAHETLVLAGEWTDPNVVSKDGQTLVEYDLDSVTAETDLVDPETVTDASGSLVVDQRGVVQRVTVNVTEETEGTTAESHYEYRVTALGDVTVEQPDWVSDATEQQGPSGPTNRLEVVAVTGDVEDGRIEAVNLTVMRAAGSDDIDLSAAIVRWVGPEAVAELEAGDSTTADTFVVDGVKDDDNSAPVVNEAADRMQISVDASQVGSGLEPGEEVQLTITTEYGTETTYWVNVPEDLAGESVVVL